MFQEFYSLGGIRDIPLFKILTNIYPDHNWRQTKSKSPNFKKSQYLLSKHLKTLYPKHSKL
jgi:hypothetical protein